MAKVGNDKADWTAKEHPASLSKRFCFESYAVTSAFLDQLAALSKETGIYPDIGFGREYANLSINAIDSQPLPPDAQEFSRRADAIYDACS